MSTSASPRSWAPAIPHPAGRILLVGPHEAGAAGLRCALESRGYRVVRIPDLPSAVCRPATKDHDVAVVDSALGGAAVLQLCAVFAPGSGLIILVGKDASALGVAALDAGADDYLVAPHNPKEIVARVRALLRRRQSRAWPAERRLGDALVLHPTGRISAPDGRSVGIPPAQYRLLEVLSRRPGQIVDRADLLQLVYGDDGERCDRTIDVHVSRLRKRLAVLDASDLITCYRGVGYRLEA